MDAKQKMLLAVGILTLVLTACLLIQISYEAQAQDTFIDNSWCDLIYSGESNVPVRFETDGNDGTTYHADCLTGSELIQKGKLLKGKSALFLAVHKNRTVNRKIILRLEVEGDKLSPSETTVYQEILGSINSVGINAEIDLVKKDGSVFDEKN